MYVTITRRGLLAGLAVVCLVAVGIVGLSFAKDSPATSASAGNWGLSFPREGDPPVGNADPAALREQDAYYVGDPTEKVIYLTFDAGYENGYTPAILDTLKKQGVPAAFFVVGHYLDTAPDLVRRMVAEGHTVGNHTCHHPDMSAISDPAAFRAELTAVEEQYKAVTGQELPRCYRPPRGQYSEQNLQMAKELGYATYFWSLAYVDWNVDAQPTREQALEKLVGRIHPGAVVLLHSTSATNAAVLDEVITKWKELGFTFGTLEELRQSYGAY